MGDTLGRHWGLGLRLSAIALLLGMFVLPLASPDRRVSAASDSPPLLDLAAMTLVPADWQAAGINLVGLDNLFGTGWIDLGRIAAVSVAGAHAGQPELGRLLMKVQQLDSVRAYQTALKQVDAAGSTNETETILTQTAQFADEQSADKMLTLITTSSDTEDVTPETNAPQVGDRSAVLRDFVPVGGSTPPRLYIAFRTKTMVAVVDVIGTVGNGKPDLDIGLALAKRLHDHIVAAHAITKSPLSNLALHLGGINYSPRLDGYVRLDHETIPYAGQTADDPGMMSRNQLYGDADAVYGLDENLPTPSGATASTTYALRIMRFADRSAAAKWIEDTPQAVVNSTKRRATAAGDKYQAQPVNGGKQIGDASQVYSYLEQSSTTTWHGYQAYFQVGSDGVQVVFEAGFEAQPELIATLAAAQASCLKQGSCDIPVSLPAKLLDTLCPTSREGGANTGSVVGTVAMPGADPARTGVFPGPAPAGGPKNVWKIPESSLDQAAPMVANGVAYFPLVTSITLPTPPYSPSVNEVVAVDASTGARKWCTLGAGAPHSAVAIAGDLIIVPESNEVVALDAATGAKRWHFDTAGDESDVAVVDGVLYVGSLDGGLTALDAKSGKALWRFQAPDEGDSAGNMPATVYSPAVADGVVYVPTQRHMYALDATSGKQVWQYTAPDSAGTFSLSPAVADGLVVIGNGLDLLALDAGTGSLRWRITPAGAVGGTPTIVNGVVYVSTGLRNDEVEGDASLNAFSAKDGAQLWTIPVKGSAQAQPAFVDGVVYFTSGVTGTNDVTSTITGVDAKTGKIEWTSSIDGPPSSPVVVGGMIYVGTGYPGTGTGNTKKTGAIYAIGGSDQATPTAHQPRSQQSNQP